MVEYIKTVDKKDCVCKIKNVLNYVEKDKFKNIIYIYNHKDITKKKIIKLLNKLKVEKVVLEKNFYLNFPQISDKEMTFFFIPEIVQKIRENRTFLHDEIYLVVNDFNNENNQIIDELTNKCKVLNIVTNNRLFLEKEKSVEINGSYISVSNNQRRALRKAEIIVNFDVKNLNKFNINQNAIIIDGSGKLNNINKNIINAIEIQSKKVLRDYEEFKNFDVNNLLKARIFQLKSIEEKRMFIKNQKIEIGRFYNKENC